MHTPRFRAAKRQNRSSRSNESLEGITLPIQKHGTSQEWYNMEPKAWNLTGVVKHGTSQKGNGRPLVFQRDPLAFVRQSCSWSC